MPVPCVEGPSLWGGNLRRAVFAVYSSTTCLCSRSAGISGRLGHSMTTSARNRIALLACLTVTIAVPCAAAPNMPPAAALPADRNRDGQHDFDFEVGTWEIHLQRRLHPLTGSNEWVRFDGTSFTRKVWGGRADLEEFETDGAGGRIEGLTLRLYNPQTHQWSLYWANSRDGQIVPAQVGQFSGDRGEFYGYDTLNGRPILIRFIWSKTHTDSPHFEQSFSEDGGRTWEVNWITDQKRVNASAINPHPKPPAVAAGTDKT